MNKRQKIMVVLCAVLLVLLTAASAVAEQELLMAADRDQAILLLREQLVARNEDFTILMPGKSMKEKEANKLYEEALEHTGNPKEGDYLRAHMIDCIPEISKTKVDKKNYVQLHYVPTYKSSAAMEQEVDAAVEAFFATYPVKEKATQYEKIEAVYDYLCDSVIYDDVRKIRPFFPDQYTLQEMNIAYTAYAALVDGAAVCEGYATAFYRLALELGIDARLVHGTAGEAHAWNLVELDGQYYYMDATWDATNYGWYDNFLQPSLWMHEPESEYLSEYAIASDTYTIPEKELFTSGDYTYSVTYGARIHAYSGQESDVVVPEKLDGIPVVSAMLYQGMPVFTGDQITSITFQEGFYHLRNTCIICPALTEVYLPSTCNWGAQEALWVIDSPNLKAIHIPESNKSVRVVEGVVYSKDGTYLIQCPAGMEMDMVTVPEGVTTVGMCAFRDCTLIRKVVLPEGLTKIVGFTFDGATALEEVNIPESCQFLDGVAFKDTAIKELNLPVGVTFVDGGLTAGAAQCQRITIPEGNPEYYTQDDNLYRIVSPEETWLLAYAMGKDDRHFTVPDGVTRIVGYAFHGSKLESVTFNEGLKEISNDSFCYSALKEVTIPASVTAVGPSAFSECPNLTTVTVLNDEAELSEGCFGWYFDWTPAPTILLRGHAGSTIETFAQTYDFPFEVIE